MAMGRQPGPSTDREKWGKILGVLVRMLRAQQKQIESLVMEKNMLEDRLSRQCERSVFDVRLYNDQISQMKREFSIRDLLIAHEEAKFDLLLSLKQREAVIYKLKLGHVECELADFRVWFDYLCHKCSNAEDISQGKLMVELKGVSGDSCLNSVSGIAAEEHCAKTTTWELKMLNGSPVKQFSKASDQIVALRSERNFVWNQYEMMDKLQNEKVQRLLASTDKKNDAITMLEIEKAKLLASVEELWSETHKKDRIIKALEAENAEKNGEISRLSKELDLAKKKPANMSVTPVLNRCSTRVKKELDYASSQVPKPGKGMSATPVLRQGDSDKGSQSLKRNGGDAVVLTPKLFSSAFKVPKLKSSSSPLVA